MAPRVGLEPTGVDAQPTESQGDVNRPDVSQTKYATKSAGKTPDDPDFAVVAAAWAALPKAVRVGIRAMVEANVDQ